MYRQSAAVAIVTMADLPPRGEDTVLRWNPSRKSLYVSPALDGQLQAVQTKLALTDCPLTQLLP